VHACHGSRGNLSVPHCARTVAGMSGDAVPLAGGTRLPSPRSRILSTAAHLFYRNGINATGIGELVQVACVSKRTLYQLFASKDELVVAYLRAISSGVSAAETALDRTELPARERLLALFDRPGTERFRGCPLHNASVELADPHHPGVAVVVAHKREFLGRLVATAREAGAVDADVLGRQLCALYEGAMALTTSLGDTESFDDARSAATLLIDTAVPMVANA
jgi:AcrR family transcriptional regulator